MKNKERLITILIILAFIAGFAIKGFYIHYTDVWERQHDVIGFGADEGQAAYIEYLLEYRHFPDFDPRTKWGFFQPPLHHILSALMIFISTKLGANYGRATENVQFLTCFYMIAIMLIMVFMYKRAREKSVNDSSLTSGLCIAMCVAGVHPIFTLLAGSINNDGLSLVLAVLALFLAIQWYEKPSYSTAILLALAIGFSMMAKLTGVLIAVPIGILLVMKFLQEIKEYTNSKNKEIFNIIKQLVVFTVVVFPIGLWWTIRNMILWDMPVSYIPGVGEQIPDNITLANRIFDLKTNSIYCALINTGAEYDEYNVPLACIKTSLFGEWNFSEISNKLQLFAIPLFVLSIVLIIMALIATFYMTFSKKSTLKVQYRVALFGTWVVYLVAYLAFAFSYRNFSAQDFRYGAICIVCEGMFLGLFADTLKSQIIKHMIMITAGCFAVCSFMTYIIIGLRS